MRIFKYHCPATRKIVGIRVNCHMIKPGHEWHIGTYEVDGIEFTTKWYDSTQTQLRAESAYDPEMKVA